MRFSKRTEWPDGAGAWTARLEAMRRENTDLIDLTETNPTRCGFEPLMPEELAFLSGAGGLTYDPDPQGSLMAREAVARYYADHGARVSPEDIFLTASTSEGYSWIFRLLCDPGDVVLSPSPSYPLFGSLAGLNDITLERYRYEYRDRWQVAPISASPRGRSHKAVIALNPNNPTGNFMDETDRELLKDLCISSGSAMIADEVFLDFRLTDKVRPRTFAAEAQVLTFTLSGLSKILGLPQMKLSWIVVSGPAAQKAEARRRLEILADTYLSVNTPVQQALPRWLGMRQQILAPMIERCQKNRAMVEEWMGNRALKRYVCEGGWHSLVACGSGLKDEELALYVLDKAGVAAYPGHFFDFDEEGILVLSHLVPEERFKEGLGRMGSAFERLGLS